jgi:nucleoside-diphosphate-sugar epimerase
VVEELVSIVNPDVAPRFGALPDRPMEQVRVADTNRSQQLMGWSPTISLAEGLRRTADWYKERLHKGLL